MAPPRPPKPPEPEAAASKSNPEIDALLLKAFEHHKAGRIAEAATGYKKILKIDPNHVDATHLIGLVFRAFGRAREAEAMFRRTIAISPKFAEAHYNLGNACFSQRKYDQAVEAYQKTAELQPENLSAHFNMGNAYREMGEYSLAIDAFRRAIAINHDYAEAWHNLANVLKDSGSLKMAIDCYRRTIKLEPALAEAHYNLALTLLLGGDLKNGFDLYEWRGKIEAVSAHARDFTQPQWSGMTITGKRLLIHAEQGFADTLQFCRYLPMVAARKAHIIVECPAPLVKLMKRIEGVAEVVESGQPLPPFDLHCPLPSLPRVFRTSRESIPSALPYLSPTPDLVTAWRQHLAEDGARFRIGLIWAGNPQHGDDMQRSLSLKDFLVLPQLAKVKYYSLQRGVAERDLEQAGLSDIVPNLAQFIEDFDDLAAVISNLDMVITTDCATAHVAGALGKPTWLILPFLPDWRWMLRTTNSPWYPGMVLYRQKERGEWSGTISRIAIDLLKYLSTVPA